MFSVNSLKKVVNWIFDSFLGRCILLIFLLGALSPIYINTFYYNDTDYYLAFDIYRLDLDVYRSGATAIVNGVNPYDHSFPVRNDSLAFTYPPLALLVFLPLAFIPFVLSEILVTGITILVAWWIIKKVFSELVSELPKNINWIVLASLGVFIISEPLGDTIRFGQINVFLMALVMLDFMVLEKSRYRGILVGFAAAIKLTPAVFGLYFLLKKDWRGAINCVLSGLGWTLLAAVILPKASLDYWTLYLWDSSRVGQLDYAANQSLRGSLARFISDKPQVALWLLASILVFVLATIAIWKFIQLKNTLGALAANSLVALLISPISWSHHWVWVMLFVPLCCYYAWHNRDIIAGILGSTALLCILSYSRFFFSHQRETLFFWSPWQKIIGSGYVIWGVLFLIFAAITPKSLSVSRRLDNQLSELSSSVANR